MPAKTKAVQDKEAAGRSVTDTAETNVKRSNLMDSERDDTTPGSDSSPTTDQSGDSGWDKREPDEDSGVGCCGSCGHSLAADVNFCPSCGVESPLTEATGSQGETGAGSPSETVAREPDVTGTIEDVTHRLEPKSEIARRLCRTLTNGSASETEIQSSLEEAIELLDTVAAVEEAVRPAKHRSSMDVFENIESELKQERGRLPAAVTSLVGELIDAKRELAQREGDQSSVMSDVRMVCSHATDSRDVSFQSRDLTDQVAELAESLEQGELVIEQATVSLSDIATTVQRERHPSSGLSRELLEVLRNPVNKSAASSTIGDCIEVIDEHQEVREMLSDIDTEDVRSRLDSVNSELRQHDTAVHNQLSKRLRELEATVDRPGPVDDVQLYAIYQEIVFYDRTLLPELSRTSSVDLSGDSSQLLNDVERRIETIEDEYISVRNDHNHSIPRHFLELAKLMVADASEELKESPDRAEGMLIAAEGLVDRVEALYQQNEYSVMLRRLRG